MERRKRIWATVGLVALVLIDIALVFAALRITSRSSDAAPTTAVTETSEAPPPATSSTSTSGPTTGSPTATSSTPVPAAAVPLTLVVAAVDGSVAWRANVGACAGGGATVQMSTDGGKTWRSRPSPYPVLTRIIPTDASKASVVGADTACSMGVRTTTDGGATWPGTGSIADTLARDPNDNTKVRAPGGRTVAPCGTVPVVDLARNSPTGAQSLCADGRLLSSTDDGATWSEAGAVPSGLALDSRVVGSAVTAFVARTLASCEGVQLSAVVGGKLADLGCAAVGPIESGKVALSAPTPQSGWLIVGTTSWRSSDGLKTWSKA
jgi:hypothetical protein